MNATDGGAVPLPPATRAALPAPRLSGDGQGPADGPFATADAAGAERLLRCWVRETGAVPDDEDGRPVLRLSLAAGGLTLRVPVAYWSPTGTHRFGPAALEGAGGPGGPGSPGAAPGTQGAGTPPVALDAVTLAALLAGETAARTPADRGGDRAAADRADLVARVADSVRRTALFLTERRAAPAAPPGTPPFLDAEQALLFGHPLHPAPKSRDGLSDAETRAYSPETRGAFPLHWFAVDHSLLATDSAWTESGRVVPAPVLAARLSAPTPPDGMVALPLHPWQARQLPHRPQVARLLDAGLLRDLGPHGAPWRPTSSLRTVYRPGAPAMLKLSLALRVTNSRREHLRKELLRGVEVHRLLRGVVGQRWRAAHPRFDIVRDPAWLAVDSPSGAPLPGLDVLLRHVPFGAAADIGVLAGLTATRPRPDRPAHRPCSRLAELVHRLAARTGRPVTAVAAEWFLRYLDAVVRPVLWLDDRVGIALEAHQQNTLVVLDRDGWPCGGHFRDNQGYYYRESRRAALDRLLPGIGVASDTFVADEVADERLAYYLGVNNVLGLVGALGAQRLADEAVLLAAFRRFLVRAAADHPGSALPATLLHRPRLRCKANLLTRLRGLDELVGPVATQSVYVTIANPLAAGPA